MSDYNVTAILSAKDEGYTRAMEKAARAAEGLEGSVETAQASMSKQIALGNIAARVVSKAMSLVSNSVSSAISRLDTLNNYPKVMQSLGYTTKEATKSVSKLSDGIEGLPTTMDEIVSSAQMLTASLEDLGKGTDTAIALNNLFLAGGQGAEAAGRALTQYNQILAKGKVDQQSWNTIVEVAPGQMSQLAKATLGATANQKALYAALQSGELTMTDLNDAIIRLNKEGGEGFASFADQAMAATGGIGTALRNLKSAVTRGLATTIDAINQAMIDADLGSISDNLTKLKGAINKVFTAIKNVAGSVMKVAAPVLKVVAANMKLILGVAVPLVAGIKAMKVVGTITEKFKAFGDRMKQNRSTIRNYSDALKNYKTAENAAKIATQQGELAAKARAEADKLAIAATNKREAALRAQNELEGAQYDLLRKNVTQEEIAVQTSQLATNAREKQAEATAAAELAQTAKINADQAEAASAGTAAAAVTLQGEGMSFGAAMAGVLTGQEGALAAAQTALNAAIAANPIGAMVMAISAAVAALKALDELEKKVNKGLYDYLDSWEQANEELQKNSDRMKENREGREDDIATLRAQTERIDKLVTEFDRLYKAEGNTETERARLAAITEELNATQDDLNLSYDKETGLLKDGTDAMKSRTKAASATSKLTKLESNLAAAIEDRDKASTELTKAQDALNEKTAAYNDALDLTNNAIPKVRENAKRIVEDYEAEKDALDSLQWQYDQTYQNVVEISKQVVTARDEERKAVEESAEAEAAAEKWKIDQIESYTAKQRAALQAGLDAQTLTLDQLTQENQDAIGELNSMWQGYLDHATDLFNTLSDEQTISVDEMIQNIETNQRIMTEWGDNMQTLRDRFEGLGLDDALLNQLADLGPEAAGYIAALVSASDEQLGTLATDYGNGGTVAGNAFYNGMSDAAAENAKTVEQFVTTTQKTITDAMEQADWTAVSKDLIDGFVEGLEGGQSDVYAASEGVGDALEEGIRDRTETNSPSKLMERIGRYQDDGLAKGIAEGKAGPLKAIISIADSIRQQMEAFTAKMTIFGRNAAQGFTYGLAGMIGEVQRAAQKLADAASGTIKTALVIKSPSHLMRKYGRFTGKGFAIGIDDMERAVRRSTDNIASVAAGLSLPSFSTSSYTSEALAATGGVAYGNGAAADYSIDLAMIVNGREFARATVDDYQNAQNQLTTRSNRLKGALA